MPAVSRNGDYQPEEMWCPGGHARRKGNEHVTNGSLAPDVDEEGPERAGTARYEGLRAVVGDSKGVAADRVEWERLADTPGHDGNGPEGFDVSRGGE